MPWSESPELKLLQVQIPIELHQKIEQLAKADKRSKAQEAVFLLEEGIKQHEMNKAMLETVRQARSMYPNASEWTAEQLANAMLSLGPRETSSGDQEIEDKAQGH